MKNSMKLHQNNSEPWRVTLVDTGHNSGTGGRLRHIRSYLDNEDFCFTYGDGVSNVDIKKLITFHHENKRLATLTAVLPPSKYGVMVLKGNKVISFDEKPEGHEGFINGGFFVLSPKVIDYIETEEDMWEHAPIKHLVAQGQLSAFYHKGFWHPMDTLRDKKKLEELWNSGHAPWKVWE